MNKYIFSTVSFILFFAVALYGTVHFHELPPFVYSALFNDWQTREMVFLPLVAGIVLWSFLHLLATHPEWHEFSNKYSENKELSFKNSSTVLHVMKNAVCIVLTLKTYVDIYHILHPTAPVMTGTTLVSIAFLLLSSLLTVYFIRTHHKFLHYSK